MKIMIKPYVLIADISTFEHKDLGSKVQNAEEKVDRFENNFQGFFLPNCRLTQRSVLVRKSSPVCTREKGPGYTKPGWQRSCRGTFIDTEPNVNNGF